VIYIGRVYGGPEVRGSQIDKVISQFVRLLGPQVKDESGSLDIVVHVPGSVFRPDFEGARGAKFSKKERMHMIQIGVPARITDADQIEMQRFLVDSLRQAVRIAKPRFEKARIPFPEETYLAQISRITASLVH